MRTLIAALGFAALAATPALAQTGVSRGSASTTAGATTGTTTTTLPSTSVGTEPVIAAPAPAGTGTSTPASGGAATGFGTNITTDPHAATPGDSFGPGGPFANDSGNSALGTPTLVPEGTVSVIGGGTTGAQVIGVPSTAQSQQVTIAGSTQTPLFDQVAREGREKEARRRARGEEPRIYGIAPNTERDLSWQMPDDRIIRY